MIFLDKAEVNETISKSFGSSKRLGSQLIPHRLQDRPNASLSGPDGYRNWLIRAPVPCMQVCWAIPVDDMAKFLREDWWQSEHEKYSHHALRMLPFAPEGRDMIPGSWKLIPPKINTGYNSNKHLGTCFQSRVLAKYLDDGIQQLCAHKQL